MSVERSSGSLETLGVRLRRERQLRQLSLGELAGATRISVRMLEALEADDYEALPAPVFVRGYLRSCARVLGVDAEELLALYRPEGEEETTAPAPVTAITAPEGSRRFGIAIAVVVLLILFTLALSVVLRPRHRDPSLELSLAPASQQLGAIGFTRG